MADTFSLSNVSICSTTASRPFALYSTTFIEVLRSRMTSAIDLLLLPFDTVTGTISPLIIGFSYSASTVVWVECCEGVGERYLHFLLLRLLTFLVAIDSSFTLTIYWLWVIVGVTTVCWLTTFLPKDCVRPLSAGGTWEIIRGCSIGASPVWSLVVAGRVVPSACCLAPSILPCMLGQFRSLLFPPVGPQ